MNFQDRRNKIQILQERANLYNQLQDKLIENEIPEEQHLNLIHSKVDEFTRTQLSELQAKRERDNPNSKLTQTLPKPQVSVLTTSAMISLGLDQYPSMTTVNQDLNENAEKNYQKYKEYKINGIPEEVKDKVRKQHQDDVTRKLILFKQDHLKDFENANHKGFKQHISQYNDEYKTNQDTINQLKAKDKTNNVKKNDLNVYFEDYLKHKSTLRK